MQEEVASTHHYVALFWFVPPRSQQGCQRPQWWCRGQSRPLSLLTPWAWGSSDHWWSEKYDAPCSLTICETQTICSESSDHWWSKTCNRTWCDEADATISYMNSIINTLRAHTCNTDMGHSTKLCTRKLLESGQYQTTILNPSSFVVFTFHFMLTWSTLQAIMNDSVVTAWQCRVTSVYIITGWMLKIDLKMAAFVFDIYYTHVKNASKY